MWRGLLELETAEDLGVVAARVVAGKLALAGLVAPAPCLLDAMMVVGDSSNSGGTSGSSSGGGGSSSNNSGGGGVGSSLLVTCPWGNRFLLRQRTPAASAALATAAAAAAADDAAVAVSPTPYLPPMGSWRHDGGSRSLLGLRRAVHWVTAGTGAVDAVAGVFRTVLGCPATVGPLSRWLPSAAAGCRGGADSGTGLRCCAVAFAAGQELLFAERDDGGGGGGGGGKDLPLASSSSLTLTSLPPLPPSALSAGPADCAGLPDAYDGDDAVHGYHLCLYLASPSAFAASFAAARAKRLLYANPRFAGGPPEFSNALDWAEAEAAGQFRIKDLLAGSDSGGGEAPKGVLNGGKGGEALKGVLNGGERGEAPKGVLHGGEGDEALKGVVLKGGEGGEARGCREEVFGSGPAGLVLEIEVRSPAHPSFPGRRG